MSGLGPGAYRRGFSWAARPSFDSDQCECIAIGGYEWSRFIVRDHAGLHLPLPDHGLWNPRLQSGTDLDDDAYYEPITCVLCRQVHMVNTATGKVLGELDE